MAVGEPPGVGAEEPGAAGSGFQRENKADAQWEACVQIRACRTPMVTLLALSHM